MGQEPEPDPDPDPDPGGILLPPLDPRDRAGECDHDDTRFLGSDAGSNQYHQCAACQAVLIIEAHTPAHPDPRHATDPPERRNFVLRSLIPHTESRAAPDHEPEPGLHPRLRALWRRLTR